MPGEGIDLLTISDRILKLLYCLQMPFAVVLQASPTLHLALLEHASSTTSPQPDHMTQDTTCVRTVQALQTRTDMGGINAARQAVRSQALSASQLQSRLDRAVLKYHTLLMRNKALQADIQELRSAA